MAELYRRHGPRALDEERHLAMMPEIISATDEWKALDALFFKGGAFGRPFIAPHAERLAEVPRPVLRAWCHWRARYNVPTWELIEWLQGETERCTLLEVGAGAGDLWQSGAIQTDSKIQADPKARGFWEAMGQPPIVYPEWVKKMDAITAARTYKPDVILASWVTQCLRPTDPVGSMGCMFGPDLLHLKNMCKRLIYIGNRTTHGDMRLLREPHRELSFPWLYSRAQDVDGNRIWIFER
jgi:hypothetical protein